jgi:hypothetical protein
MRHSMLAMITAGKDYGAHPRSGRLSLLGGPGLTVPPIGSQRGSLRCSNLSGLETDRTHYNKLCLSTAGMPGVSDQDFRD